MWLCSSPDPEHVQFTFSPAVTWAAVQVIVNCTMSLKYRAKSFSKRCQVSTSNGWGPRMAVSWLAVSRLWMHLLNCRGRARLGQELDLFFFFQIVSSHSFLFLLTRTHCFIYFRLCWVFLAAHKLSQVVESGDYSLAAVHRLLIAVASLVVEHRL